MKYRITQLDDVDEAREIHGLAFPDDIWVGKDHEFWVARDETGRVAGLCSARFDADSRSVFLSRAAVVVAAQGQGLHRRMIHIRCQWGRRMGARVAVTYTAIKNYESMVALLKAGFRFKNLQDRDGWHYLYRPLYQDFVPGQLKAAFDWV